MNSKLLTSILKMALSFIFVLGLIAMGIVFSINAGVGFKEYGLKTKVSYNERDAVFVEYKNDYDFLAGKCFIMVLEYKDNEGNVHKVEWDKPVVKEEYAIMLIGYTTSIFVSDENNFAVSSLKFSYIPSFVSALCAGFAFLFAYIFNLALMSSLVKIRYFKILNILTEG